MLRVETGLDLTELERSIRSMIFSFEYCYASFDKAQCSMPVKCGVRPNLSRLSRSRLSALGLGPLSHGLSAGPRTSTHAYKSSQLLIRTEQK